MSSNKLETGLVSKSKKVGLPILVEWRPGRLLQFLFLGREPSGSEFASC